MTKLIVDGKERADEWDHLAGDEVPGGGSFTAGIGLARSVSGAGAAAAAPGRGSFTESIAAIAPEDMRLHNVRQGDVGFTESITAIAPDGSASGSRTPPGLGFTVDLARWLAQRHDLIAHAEGNGRRLGVRLAPGDDPMRLADDVGRFTLIVIEIPSATDGRFFSIAARLREHLRYRHELRATGDVAPDQLSFMQRCGIDAFEIGDHVDVERFIRRYRRFYQTSGPLTTRDNQIRLARRHGPRAGSCVDDPGAPGDDRSRPARRHARPGDAPRRGSEFGVDTPAGDRPSPAISAKPENVP